MIQKSTSLEYEPASELLLVTAEQLFLHRELHLAVQLSVHMAAVLVAIKGSLSRTLPDAACVLQVQTAHPNIHNPNIHTTRNIHTRGTRPFCTGVPLS